MNPQQKQSRKRICTVTLALGGMLAASMAIAAGDEVGNDTYANHGGHGYQNDPSFVDRGDTLLAYGEVRGLKKNRDVRVEIEAEARVRVECRRQGGGHGGGYGGGHGGGDGGGDGHGYGDSFHKTIDIDVDGSRYFSSHKIHGNRLDYSVETDELYDIEHYYGYVCPANYRARIRSVRFSSARVEVRQGHSNVMTWLCSFDRDTKDGKVPRSNVDCYTLY